VNGARTGSARLRPTADSGQSIKERGGEKEGENGEEVMYIIFLSNKFYYFLRSTADLVPISSPPIVHSAPSVLLLDNNAPWPVAFSIAAPLINFEVFIPQNSAYFETSSKSSRLKATEKTTREAFWGFLTSALLISHDSSFLRFACFLSFIFLPLYKFSFFALF
jgi:hypothetical protein